MGLSSQINYGCSRPILSRGCMGAITNANNYNQSVGCPFGECFHIHQEYSSYLPVLNSYHVELFSILSQWFLNIRSKTQVCLMNWQPKPGLIELLRMLNFQHWLLAVIWVEVARYRQLWIYLIDWLLLMITYIHGSVKRSKWWSVFYQCWWQNTVAYCHMLNNTV